MNQTFRKLPFAFALAILLMLAFEHVSRSQNSDTLNSHLTELGGSFETIFTLAQTDTALFYGYSLGDNREIRRWNYDRQIPSSIAISRVPMRLFPASPDGRYQLLKTISIDNSSAAVGSSSLSEWMTSIDCQTSKILFVTNLASLGRFPVWINNHSFIFIGRTKMPASIEEAYVMDLQGKKSPMSLRQVFPEAAAYITNSSQELIYKLDNTVAFNTSGNLVSLDIRSGKLETLADFSGRFSRLEWLRFSKETGLFLFCATQVGDNFRSLFQYDPASKTTTQLSTQFCYNGQWLNGKGYAYVCNTNNGFYLAVRPEIQDQATNLFTNGHVERYIVSPDGLKLYSVASSNGGPRSLWEYDIRSRSLRIIENASTVPFKVSKICAPQETNFVSFDALNIPVYVFWPHPPPVGTTNARLPLAIYIPPRSAQCTRGFELQPQLLANSGFVYAGINYRGIDGYGKHYSSLWSPQDAARDVLAVVHALKNDVRIDPNRVVLIAMSAASEVLNQVLQMEGSVAKAAVFESPQGFVLPSVAVAKTFPSILVTIGRQDPAFDFANEFKNWARPSGIPFKLEVIEDLGHSDTPKRSGRIDQERKTARFLLDRI